MLSSRATLQVVAAGSPSPSAPETASTALYFSVGATLHLPEQVIEWNLSQQAQRSAGRKLPPVPRREVNSEDFGNLAPVRAAPSDYSASFGSLLEVRTRRTNTILTIFPACLRYPLFLQTSAGSNDWWVQLSHLRQES